MIKLTFENPYDRALDKKTKEKKIILRHGHIAITNYHMGDNMELEHLLSVWDAGRFKYKRISGYYMRELKEFRIGRGFDIHKLSTVLPEYRQVAFDNHYNTIRSYDYDLTVSPRDDFQKVALTAMAAEGPYKKYRKYSQQLITAGTGKGKSYCGAAIAAYYKARAVIICPISEIMEQWKNTFLNFTTLTEDDILLVKGSPMCKKIRNGVYKDKVIFIFSADTIVSYTENNGDRAAVEMLNQTGAAIKIIDEIHKDLKAVALIEAVSNFRMNYYMSASPTRTQHKEKYIFDLLYRGVPKFGKEFSTKEERHINIIVKKYEFDPNPSQIREMYNPRRGLNSSKYESVLMSASENQRESFDTSLKTILLWAKKRLIEGNKILVLCKTRAGTMYIEEIASEIFKPKNCSHYFSTGMKPDEKEEAKTKTVICATASSMGTGTDIKGLQFVINITTYSNPIDATQLPGRARKLQDGTSVFYIELVNIAYNNTIKQYNTRKKYLADNAAGGKIIVIS